MVSFAKSFSRGGGAGGALNRHVVAQFIPFLMLLFFVLSPLHWLQFTDSVLGKFVLLGIVVFYTALDKLVGTIVATMFIVYYNSDFATRVASGIAP